MLKETINKHEVELNKIATLFEEYRTTKTDPTVKTPYPESLKQICINAVKNGIGVSMVSRCAKISDMSLYKWLKDEDIYPQIKELTIVKEEQESDKEINKKEKDRMLGAHSSPMAEVLLRSGIVLKIPFHHMSKEFILELDGLL